MENFDESNNAENGTVEETTEASVIEASNATKNLAPTTRAFMHETTIKSLRKDVGTLINAYPEPVFCLCNKSEEAWRKLLAETVFNPLRGEADVEDNKKQIEAFFDNSELNLAPTDEYLIVEGRGIEDVNGDVVNHTSNLYQVVQHSEAFTPLLNELERIGVDKCRARLDVMPGAAVLWVAFPNNWTYTGPDGSTFTPMICAYNSYDGSYGIGYRGGAMRLECENGLTSRRLFAGLQLKHMAGVLWKIEEFAKGFGQNMENFMHAIESAREIGVTTEEAMAYFRDFFGTEAVGQVLQLWNGKYASEQNMYGVHLAITDIASHKPASPRRIMDNFKGAEIVIEFPEQEKQKIPAIIEGQRRADEEKAARAAEKTALRAEKAAKEETATAETPTVDLGKADPMPTGAPETPETPEKKNGKKSKKNGKKSKKNGEKGEKSGGEEPTA